MCCVVITVMTTLYNSLESALSSVIIIGYVRRVGRNPKVTEPRVRPEIRERFSGGGIFSPYVGRPTIVRCVGSGRSGFTVDRSVTVFFFVVRGGNCVNADVGVFRGVVTSLIPYQDCSRLSRDLRQMGRVCNCCRSRRGHIELIHGFTLIRRLIGKFLRSGRTVGKMVVVGERGGLAEAPNPPPFEYVWCAPTCPEGRFRIRRGAVFPRRNGV